MNNCRLERGEGVGGGSQAAHSCHRHETGVALSVTKAVQLQVSDLLDLEKPERLTNEHMLPGGRWGGAGSQAAIRAATSIQHDVKGGTSRQYDEGQGSAVKGPCASLLLVKMPSSSQPHQALNRLRNEHTFILSSH